MLKAIKRLFQQEKEKYRIPRKVQDLIPINCVWKDGIFLCNQKYSMCYRFTDINYQVASGEDQRSMIGLYGNILNGLDTTGTGAGTGTGTGSIRLAPLMVHHILPALRAR